MMARMLIIMWNTLLKFFSDNFFYASIYVQLYQRPPLLVTAASSTRKKLVLQRGRNCQSVGRVLGNKLKDEPSREATEFLPAGSLL